MELNLFVVPFVGETVEPLTPLEKYDDLEQSAKDIHYSLKSMSVEKQLSVMRNFKELHVNGDFQEARKLINDKEFYPANEYNARCLDVAEKLDIQTKDLDMQQRIEAKLALSSNHKFDKDMQWNMATSPKFSYILEADKNGDVVKYVGPKPVRNW